MSANQQKENDAKKNAFNRVDQYRQTSRSAATEATTAAGKLDGYRKALAEMGFVFPNTGESSPIPSMNLRREIVIELNSDAKK
jgi:hypothetical protein